MQVCVNIGRAYSRYYNILLLLFSSSSCNHLVCAFQVSATNVTNEMQLLVFSCNVAFLHSPLYSLDPLSSFGGYSLSLQEVAQRWQSRDTASVGNDGEDR